MEKTVLFVTPSLGIGGVERELVTIANALAEKDYNVTILTLFPQDAFRALLNPTVKYIYKPMRRFAVMQKIPYIKDAYYGAGMWETRATPEELYDYYVGSKHYDIEIGFFRGLAVKVISGSSNKDSLKIAWVHSDFKDCIGIQSFFSSMENVKKAYGRYDKIICVSEQVKTSFREVIGFPEKLRTLYNMIPLDEIKAKAAEACPRTKNRYTVLSVSRLFEAKSFDRLLEVSKRLNDDGFLFDLWIVGEGSERRKLEDCINREKLDNVFLCGEQRNPYSFMRAADLYVCSSLWEGFNLTVAEALCCGTPVLSTNCTGPNEILEHGKYGLIVDNSIEGIYEGIRTFLTNPHLSEKYTRLAFERASFFNIDKNIDKMITALTR